MAGQQLHSPGFLLLTGEQSLHLLHQAVEGARQLASFLRCPRHRRLTSRVTRRHLIGRIRQTVNGGRDLPGQVKHHGDRSGTQQAPNSPETSTEFRYPLPSSQAPSMEAIATQGTSGIAVMA